MHDDDDWLFFVLCGIPDFRTWQELATFLAIVCLLTAGIVGLCYWLS